MNHAKSLQHIIDTAPASVLARVMRRVERRLKGAAVLTGHTRVYYAATKAEPRTRLEPKVAQVYRALKRQAATTPLLAETLPNLNINTIRYATQILRQIGAVVSVPSRRRVH